ncbi:MAG: hypothetical protein EA367_11665 [Leptolyngbya sp. DLM2.Bin15]|nr:MAG: hypothetical protein EA367_11665 [Leptolyngbya sp. DLM2.Bin15]
MMPLAGCLHRLVLLAVAGSLILSVAIGLPGSIWFHQVTNPTIVKDWLAQADVYATMPLVGFASRLERIADQDEASPNLAHDALLQRYGAQFPYRDGQRFIDRMLDGHYRYLRGQADAVVFSADLGAIAPYLQNQVPPLLDHYIQELPTCPPTEDAHDRFLRGDCIPESMDRQEVSDRFLSQWAIETELLQAVDLTQVDYDALQGWRRFFQVAQQFIEICVAMLLLTSGLLVYAQRDRHRGYQELRTCWLIGSIGAMILLGLVGWLLWYVVRSLELGAIENISTQLMREITRDLLGIMFRTTVFQTLFVCILATGLSWMAARWTRPRPQSPHR